MREPVRFRTGSGSVRREAAGGQLWGLWFDRDSVRQVGCDVDECLIEQTGAIHQERDVEWLPDRAVVERGAEAEQRVPTGGKRAVRPRSGTRAAG